jgi:hypothetical protein
MIQLGNVLVNAPEEPDGLWIHPVIAKALNGKKRSDLRARNERRFLLSECM